MATIDETGVGKPLSLIRSIFDPKAWLKPKHLHPQVESIIYWRDVKKSALVFSAGLMLLLAITIFSAFSVFATLSLIILMDIVVIKIYKSVKQAVFKTNDADNFKKYLEWILDLSLSPENVQQIAVGAVAYTNTFVAEMRRLFLVEDPIDSIKFGFILWIFTHIGAWFNAMTLVVFAFILLFTIPKIYEKNKQSIDTNLDLMYSIFTETTAKIQAAIRIGKNKPVLAEADKDK
ncbi:hypothetical protein KR026_009355 [Drosophila bipectinata]|nr:hypothetical protein KR026_009355 [Drosophila bipectinata]